MKELEKIFIGRGEVKGFKFEQVSANSFGFIYKVQNNNTVYYEVFSRKENTQFNTVSYPSSKAFGVWAWWYGNFERAIIKFNSFR